MSRAIAEGPVHVAHVLSSFGMGGQERVALDLATCQVAAGHRVSAVSLAQPPDGPLADSFRAAGVGVARVARSRPGVDPGLVVRLARWLARSGVTLAHTHNPMALLYGAPAARLAGAAVVHTKHGINPGGRARLLAARLAARWADAFVAVSPETAATARRRSEVAEGRLSVIPNGIVLGRFRPDPAARARIRAELGVPDAAWVVGTVGRVAPEKNQALLLRAAAPSLAPLAHLMVAGDGPLQGALSELAASLGISPFVHLLGARADVPDLLNAMDAFVLCSNSEGLPLVIPEAMATGLPVVATKVGGIPSVIEEGVTGWLVAPEGEQELRARLAALRADPASTRATGARARSAAIDRFSVDRMYRDYAALYDRVLSGSGRGRPGPGPG